MPPKLKSRKSKPLTASEYVLYNQMVLGFHTLEYAATYHFLKVTSDRKKLAALVQEQIVRSVKALRGDYCECPPGTCEDRVRNGVVCRPCGGFPPGALEELILETGWFIDELGPYEFSKQLAEMRKGLRSPTVGR